MTIEVVDALLQGFGDRVGRFEVRVVQRGFLQHEEPSRDSFQARLPAQVFLQLRPRPP